MNIKRFTRSWHWCESLFMGLMLACLVPQARAVVDISNLPLFLGGNGVPLAMLIMGRDHKLYYEAYNDASDINQDGQIDVGYKPALTQDNQPLNYFGYFDSYKCYSYSNGVFIPTVVTANKKCSGAWSGDFLNYLTTSRVDALRRVLYGGYRYVDSTTETILERARVPQDAHSWGKEYKSIDYDGYDIREYTPLDLPATNTRHLFANTTLQNDVNQLPLLRVLTNSNYRIWEWVAIERPVAGDKCLHGGSGPDCATAGGTLWEIVPSGLLTLTQTVHKITTRNSSTGTSHPGNSGQFDSLVLTNAITANLCGSQSVSTINGSGNPFNGINGCTNDNYLNVFTGQINIPTAGTYTFSVDGDDAVDLQIDGTTVASWYGGHGNCNCNTYSGSISLSAGVHTLRFRHEENTGGDNYYLRWQRTIPASVRTDYTVRVKACVSGLLELECKGYPESNPTVYKPTGLLHDYGETDRMAFGLLTGSFKKNLSGGTLRKNISSFKNEIDASTGQFVVPANAGSIVDTISKIRIVGFRGSYSYNDGGCSVPMVTAMQEGRCAMWGNPIAEMMYEGMRYFAGQTGAASAYDFTDEFSSFVTEDKLNLPKPTWSDPYRSEANGGYPYCSRPFEVVIADIPSFDTDQLPGVDANFGSGISSNIGNLNVASIGQTIWNNEEGSGAKKIFIGQSGNVYDTAPTPKDVSSFGNIRGLSPEEPTRQGGYYAASLGYFGKTTGIRQISVPGLTNPHIVKTDVFGVSLSSPLPTINIPMAEGKIITVVPFAKSVGGNSINATKGQFQPTNTIVDFFVETIANTGTSDSNTAINEGRPYIKFRINYEDSEYGSDHDMDAIVTYTFTVNASNQLVISLSSDYEAGSVLHHIGYVISGTTHDGVYLEVRDWNQSSNSGNPSSDVDYFLDTPAAFTGTPPAPDSGSGTWSDGVALPTQTSRTFSPSAPDTITATFIKHDPLWYASKWGGFIENTDDVNNLPDKQGEWDRNGDGKPDNYFLVTNAGKLKKQLSETFEEIVRRTSSAAAVAANSSSLIAGGRLFQARFNSGDWTGELRALSVNPNTGAVEANPITGAPLEIWTAQAQLKDQNFDTGRQILTIKPSAHTGIPFRWPSSIPSDPNEQTGSTALDQAQLAALKGSGDNGDGTARLNYLRGDATNEDPAGKKYRKRANGTVRNVLGDIVNSSPFYVAAPSAGYPFGDYRTFSNTHQNRRPMVYIGANDGMLHGFDANSGQEVFAYVPGAVFNKLSALTELTYKNLHQFYVDASPTAIDVQFSDESWHTVLVGGLRSGGVSYFALDVTAAGTVNSSGAVTSAGSLTEANAASVVLWEFTDNDLGLSFSQPSLVRRSDGDNDADNNPWVAVFGNGYNSNNVAKTPTTTAVLYVVNAQTGALVKKIDVGEGQGLSTPSVVDSDGDDTADFIYAGDLEGNLWRFDIRNSDPNSWTYTKLFIARDANGAPQPITAAPQVTRQPSSATDPNTSLMVVFGTGRYLGTTDVISTDQQTFYGVWDDVSDTSACPAGSTTACFARANLQAQIYCPGSPADSTCQAPGPNDTTVTSAGAVSDGSGRNFRITSARCVEYGAVNNKLCADDPPKAQQRGWYLDLKLAGERVVSDPLIVGSRVAFTSILPNADPCQYGGNSWLNVLSATSGQRLSATFLGVGSNANTPVTEASTGFAPSSVAIVGIASAPNVMRAPDQQKSILYVSTSGGTVENYAIVDTEIGRQSWRQLEFQ